MTTDTNSTESTPPNRDPLDLPEHLPPVQPPSAGFIIQLFVVPAIIVAVVVGLYLLFTRMASGEADWRQLVSDIRSENPHVRWSSANQLATLLTDAAQQPKDPASVALSANREIAQALVAPFTELAKKTTLTDEESIQLEFLGKAIGQLNVPDLVVPPLLDAARSDRTGEAAHTLRKTALNSLAMIVGRARDDGRLANLPRDFDSQVGLVADDREPLFRNQAAFILGLSGRPEALERLQAMLEDPETHIRVNAAIGLARNDSKRGLPVLEEILKESADWKMEPPAAGDPEEKIIKEEGVRFERIMMLKNALQAVGALAPQMSDTERERVAAEVKRIGATFPEVTLRSVALSAADKLAASK